VGDSDRQLRWQVALLHQLGGDASGTEVTLRHIAFGGAADDTEEGQLWELLEEGAECGQIGSVTLGDACLG